MGSPVRTISSVHCLPQRSGSALAVFEDFDVSEPDSIPHLSKQFTPHPADQVLSKIKDDLSTGTQYLPLRCQGLHRTHWRAVLGVQDREIQGAGLDFASFIVVEGVIMPPRNFQTGVENLAIVYLRLNEGARSGLPGRVCVDDLDRAVVVRDHELGEQANRRAPDIHLTPMKPSRPLKQPSATCTPIALEPVRRCGRTSNV